MKILGVAACAKDIIGGVIKPNVTANTAVNFAVATRRRSRDAAVISIFIMVVLIGVVSICCIIRRYDISFDDTHPNEVVQRGQYEGLAQRIPLACFPAD
ncbi:hypothetical protein [Herbaspirillum sp. YR522]|uniref:hypothetical protein n=1 Tax=Herbaspirillum sp. YR522 TaxID=1144342 RepID=UPI0012F78717|nr:hypothetical protein [Herbaspirillum sp. YR522]